MTLSNEAATYEGVRESLTRAVRGIARRLRADEGDVAGEADEQFVLLLRSFDPARGAFAAQLNRKLRNRILNVQRTERNRRRIEAGLPARRVGFDLAGLLLGLSRDGAAVVDKVIQGGIADRLDLIQSLQEAGWGRARWRAALREVEEYVRGPDFLRD